MDQVAAGHGVLAAGHVRAAELQLLQPGPAGQSRTGAAERITVAYLDARALASDAAQGSPAVTIL